jgi:hypothetical protein
MRIEQSQVGLASRRVANITDTARSSMQAWLGDKPADAVATTLPESSAADAAKAAVAKLSADAQKLAQQAGRLTSSLATSVAKGSSASATTDMTDPTTTDANLRILIMFVERLTGHKVHLIRPGDVRTDAESASQQAGAQAGQAVAPANGQSASSQSQQAGWGVDVKVEQSHQETETTGFTANGQVVTADGRTISFEYQTVMHRDFTQTSTVEIQAGDAVKKVDPIALNLTGGPVALSSARSAFDLNADGAPEQVALPVPGTYFLALDRNGNGTIDSGSELFGPTTGNGFTELRKLDSNGNGWIDEGDAAYASLKLWSGPDGKSSSLDQTGVGALYVGQNVSTQFDLRGDTNETLGQIVSSSVYLSEDGKPGAMQQVDLTA